MQICPICANLVQCHSTDNATFYGHYKSRFGDLADRGSKLLWKIIRWCESFMLHGSLHGTHTLDKLSFTSPFNRCPVPLSR